jgi:hypothetical protein
MGLSFFEAPLEMTVLEPLRCPSCSTRFGLSASRVHAGIRRARCFRCDAVFGIEDVVARLLPFAPLPAPEPVPAPEALLEAAEPAIPAAASEVLAIPEPSPEPLPEPEGLALAAAFDQQPPSLTLGDLEGAEDEILEKTLIIPPPELPAAPSQPAASPEDFDFFDPGEPASSAGGGNYSSARDAIEKLMGAAPTVNQPPRALGTRSSMDVEATLSALDQTLGGTPVAPPEPAPAPAPEAVAEPEPAAPLTSSSTVKLSSREIMAAISAMPPPPPATAEAAAPEARTEFMARPDPALFVDPAASQDPSLLKVQLEQETCNNVTLEQMSAWIDQGRVKEYHMVARQFSENWIEAVKVPSLRPVFDRRRRQTSPSEDLPVPPAEILPPKKSLFGGFFGRN